MSQGSPKLITIPVSHYCEKARWALERAGLEFEERRHLQLLHYAATLWHAGTLFAPVLLTSEGTYTDSTDILDFVDRRVPGLGLFPKDPELNRRVRYWEARFDQTVGVEGRRWMYHAGFRELGAARMIELAAQGVPGWQTAVVRALIAPGEAYLRYRLSVNDATVEQGLATLERVFDEVANELRDGRPYLAGEHFSAADLTFAALSAFPLMPPEYGVRLPQPGDLPPGMRAVVERFRSHTAGQYALRLYRQER